MRVLVLHQYFQLPNQPGSTRLYSFLMALNDGGHDVTVITGSRCRRGLIASGAKRQDKRLCHKFLFLDSIEILSINDFYDQKLSFMMRLVSFAYFSLLSTVLSLMVRKPDIIFASSTPLTITIPALISSKIRNKRFILEIRDLWPEAPIQLGLLKNRLLIFLAETLEKFAYRNAATIIALSKGICNKIKFGFGFDVHFIPNGVDEEFYRLSTVNYSQTNDRRVYPLRVVYAGSCGFNNAIEVIFEVARRAFQDQSIANLVKFIIVGDGPVLTELKKNTPKNMELKGKLSKMETIKILVDSDIAFFSVRKVINGDLKKDSLANKYFDFLGAGLPIVAGVVKDGEMAQEILENGCGLIAEPEDVDGCYKALRELILSAELRDKMAASSRQLALKYSRKEQSKFFVLLLEKIFKGNQCNER